MTQKRKGLHERHATAPLSPIETGVLDELQSLLATAAAHPPDSERVASLDDATTATAPTPPPPPTATGFDPAKTPHAGRVVMPAAKPGAKILRGSVVGDLRATLEETRSLLSDRDEQLRKSRLREAELMTALERERQCVSRAERRIETLERALGVADPQGVFPVPANVHTENDELEASAQILEASFDEYLDEKSVTEREHGSRDLKEPLDIVARAEAAVRGAIDEAARAVCAEASAKEAVRLMTEAETQTALAEALRASRRREEALAARISVLERDRAARISVGSRGPPSIIPSAAREAILAKAASREANLEHGDGRSRGFAPSPALVQLLNKESSGHRSRADGVIVTS